MQRKPAPKREIQSSKSKAPVAKQASKNTQGETKSNWNIPVLLVMGLTLLAYAQVFGFFYLNWDDNLNITENPNVTNFTLQKIGDIFSLDHGTIIGNYNPLPILSFGLEKLMIGGLNPIVAHGINLAFHIASVYLVYRLFLLLKFENFGALFIALLFGIHPMRVESVAWVTERKDVLFAFFFLLSLIQYMRVLQNKKSTKNYALMLVFALLAMLSKVQAVSLPLTMLMIDYWMKRPSPLKLIMEKWPLWLMSLGTGLLTIYTLRTYGSLDTAFQDQSILLKLGIATTSFVTYLYKFVVPFPMIPLYPFPSELSAFAYLSMVVVAAIIGLCVAFRKNEAARIWIFGLGFFTVNVIFVLQFVNAGQGYMADRFTYMSYIGLFAVLAWYLQKWQKLASRKNLAQVVTYGSAAICLLLTYVQLPIWKDSGALWTHVIDSEGGSKIPLPFINRGTFYRSSQLHDLAVQDLAKAIQVKPDEPEAYLAMGKTYFDQAVQKEPIDQTLLSQSIDWYQRGIAITNIDPFDKANLITNMATSYAAMGQNERAITEFANAEQLDSNILEIYLNRSLLYVNAKQYPQALLDYDHIVRMGAANADIYYERGMCHASMNNQTQAIQNFDAAIRLESTFANAYLERARSHAATGRMDEARKDLQTSLKNGGNPGPELRKQIGI